MFEEAVNADNGFYARAWGIRRSRQLSNIKLSTPNSATMTYGPYSSGPLYSYSNSLGTPWGLRKVTVDQNNAYALNRGKTFRDKRRFSDTGGPFWSETIEVNPPQYVKKRWEKPDGLGATRLDVDAYVNARNYFPYAVDLLKQGTLVGGARFISDSDLRGLGATGIARTLPTKPEMSLSTALAELKEGLPSLIGTQLLKDRSIASIGGEFLNYSFGIAPTVSDVTDLLSLTSRYEKILKQFKRDNGKVVRRRISLVDETSIETKTNLDVGATHGSWSPQSARLSADKTTVKSIYSRRVWFSGAFKLAYPLELDNFLSDLIEFNRVYGVIPTPELAWNLMPFSWLVDWFSNVGDIFTNVSTLGSSLQLVYGYVMCEDKKIYQESGSYLPDYTYLREWVKNDPITITSELVHTRKRRLAASPFGFSTRFSELTTFQKGILGALGLSRLDFKN